MAKHDSNTPENSPDSTDDRQAAEEELQAGIAQIEQLKADYDALTGEQKAALPESFRRFFEGE